MNELDKIFQSKLENHTADYAPQTWDKIQARLKQQKTKPRNPPWLWMSLAAVAVLGILYLLEPSDDGERSVTLSGNAIANTVASNDASKKKAAVTTYIETSSNEASLSSIASNQVISNSNAQKETGQELINYDNQLNNSISVSAGSNENQLKANSRSIARSAMNKFTIDSSKPSETINTSNSKIINTNTSMLKEASVRVNANRAQTEVVNAAVGLRTGDVLKTAVSKQLDIRPLRTIGVSSFTMLFSEGEDADVELSKSMMDDFRQDCPSFVTDRTGVYLDFYVSHELPFSSLTAKNQELNSYQELRSSSEGPTYSFSAGARLTLMLPNGLGLKTGLNYSQVNEKFSYVDPESDLVKEVITITTVGGIEVRDTNIIIIPGIRDVVSTNKYRSFDIPLLLSYEWDVRERTYMTVNGGIYLNLLFKESGKILDPSGEVIGLKDTSGDQLAIFKNNIGLSLFGSVGLHYRWNSNIDFILEPNVRMLVKSATVEGYSLEHKWITGGLITGMRYNF